MPSCTHHRCLEYYSRCRSTALFVTAYVLIMDATQKEAAKSLIRMRQLINIPANRPKGMRPAWHVSMVVTPLLSYVLPSMRRT